METSTTANDADKRGAERFEIPTDGQVILPSGSRVPIQVVDISQRGARFKLGRILVLPSEFVIDVTSPDRKKVKRCDCKRTWQRQAEVGVQFITTRVIKLDNHVL